MKKINIENFALPSQVPETIDEMTRRFVRGDVVLACDRHAPSVRAFVTSLTSIEECDDQILLDLAAALNCIQCNLITSLILGQPSLEAGQVERVVALCQTSIGTSGENTVGRPAAADRHQQVASNVTFMSQRRVLTVDPICLPIGPFCPTPVRLAAAQGGWTGILFGHEQPMPLATQAFPKPVIRGGQYPLVVTTSYRAQLEYAKGNDWHVALPLAPQRTVVVVRRNSRLYDTEHQISFNDHALIRRLGGCVLAVADTTSSYASRLILAARQASVQEKFVSRGMLNTLNKNRSSNHLYLIVEPSHDKMIDLLEDEKIDGFSTVEPAPTLAKVRLGSRCADATMQDSCTSATSGFCCVVMTPAELARNPEPYDALLRALISSICGLMKEEGLQALIKLFEKTLKGLPMGKYPLEPKAIATQAAVNTLRHFTAHLQPHLDDPEECSELLLPEITIEAIRAEATALSPHLKGHERAQWLRGLERLDDPKQNLYDFKRAREIFRDILPKDFKGEIQSLDAALRSNQAGK